jgi:hypothetical protein
LGAPIILIYNDSNFSMVNAGDYAINVQDMQFIRGVDGGNDDYTGDRVRQDILPPSSCARVQLQGKQNDAPPQCRAIQSAEFLTDQTRLFWRKETTDGSTISTFEVWYKGSRIQLCDTVARGGDHECRFNWPVPPPTPVSS